jgi:antitoxin HicB
LKNLDYYLSLNYPFNTRPLSEDEGSGWMVEFSDFAGIIGTGGTIDEAIKDAMEAKNGWIEILHSEGKEIPQPNSGSKYNGKFVLRMPKSIHKWVDVTASYEGVSINQFINHVLSEAKGKRKLI